MQAEVSQPRELPFETAFFKTMGFGYSGFFVEILTEHSFPSGIPLLEVNLPGISDRGGDLIDEADYIAFDTEPYHWNDNHNAIPAFAAFCKEGCHQDMDTFEAYTPYAILRRQENGIEVEVVGKMLRPWLDGIKPDWD